MKNFDSGYQCVHCENTVTQWVGKCPQCGEWNTIVEKLQAQNILNTESVSLEIKNAEECKLSELVTIPLPLIELERVLGGGLTCASITLIAGEPGIGKSTLVLQIAESISERELTTLYITGEENLSQVALRIDRLGIKSKNILLMHGSSWQKMVMAIEKTGASAVIIDSIQTTYSEECSGVPGAESQVKTVSNEIVKYVKSKGITTIITGQITKHGTIAGPKFLEHIVDIVLYFEGERSSCSRHLRAFKNRFGATDEIGVFDLTAKGLIDGTVIADSVLDDFSIEQQGIAYSAVKNGGRFFPLKVESFMRPRSGNQFLKSRHYIDQQRLAMLVGLLEVHSTFKENSYELYLNVVGKGMSYDTQSDLTIMTSLYSSYLKRELPKKLFVVGEVGLNGNIHPYKYGDELVKKMGMFGVKRIWGNITKTQVSQSDIEITQIKNLGELIKLIQSPSSDVHFQ